MKEFEKNLEFAKRLDAEDPLKRYRSQFHFPKVVDSPVLYFTGNSLGLQPQGTEGLVLKELEKWKRLAVEAHLVGDLPWLPYHEFLTDSLARLTGAKTTEVVAMNGLTVNLHLAMLSFYRPTPSRYLILIESGAFPSDQYAVQSQADFHGYRNSVMPLMPRNGEDNLRTSDIIKTIEENQSSIAIILLGQPNYRTGQSFDIKAIAQTAQRFSIPLGLDLAHGIGNLELRLHDWGVDFAVWCSYKYLNAGPGGLAGLFVHEKYHGSNLPRLTGWWGHDKKTRFEMPEKFKPIPTVEAWQLSNPPIFQAAALRSSLSLFDEAGMVTLRQKSEKLTGFLEFLCAERPLTLVTPNDPTQRGCQLSFRHVNAQKIVSELKKRAIFCDFRYPDLIRAAPVPFYNSFEDVFRFSEALCQILG